jgi:hypothetical protein
LGIGLGLMTGELFVPVTVFLWTGIAAVLVAVPDFLWPDLPLIAVLGLWALLSLVSVLAVRVYHRGHPLSGERLEPAGGPNRYGSEFIGMTATLHRDSENLETRVNLKGANWGVKLKGGDLKAGSHIRVVGLDGIFLVAEPLEEKL